MRIVNKDNITTKKDKKEKHFIYLKAFELIFMFKADGSRS